MYAIRSYYEFVQAFPRGSWNLFDYIVFAIDMFTSNATVMVIRITSYNVCYTKLLRLGLPVVIMAGGKGTRLKPLTNVIPKPLIPIGDKTILEDIMDSFCEYDCSRFYISVNYRAEMIKYYLNNQAGIKYNSVFFVV